MSTIITRSTRVLHPDDRLALWYSQRQAYLNFAEIAHRYGDQDGTHREGQDAKLPSSVIVEPQHHRNNPSGLQPLHTAVQAIGWMMVLGLTFSLAVMN